MTKKKICMEIALDDDGELKIIKKPYEAKLNLLYRTGFMMNESDFNKY